MVCTRCKALMYPYKSGSTGNHAKGYCSDGAPVKFGWQSKWKLSEKDKQAGPLWPLPSGIFTAGESFHPVAFFKAMRDIYQKAFVDPRPHPSQPDPLLEYEGFASFLQQKTVVLADGASLFELPRYTNIVWPSQFSEESKQALLYTHNDLPHLRLTCLQPVTDETVQ